MGTEVSAEALRILFVSDVSPLLPQGGGERVLWEQARGLARAGHRVRVLGRAPDGAAPGTVEQEGVRIRHFPVDRRSTLRFLRSAVLGAGRLAGEELAREPADVLHFHQPLSAWGVLRATAGQRLPSLYTFLSPAALEYRSRRGTTAWHRGGLAGRLVAALLGRVERDCLRRVRRIRVLSDFSAGQVRELHRVGPERILKIPGGVDLARFRPDADRPAIRSRLGLPEGPLLFTLRNLEPRMGLDSLLRAMAPVRERLPEVRLLVGGAGSLRPELERLVARLALGEHVRFLGFVDERVLPLYYQAADFFVLPTRELEGFGLVTAEALACGTPVLGTPVGATPEILREIDPGLLFDGTAPAALADGIQRHLAAARQHPGRYEALRHRCASQAASRFGWEAVVERLGHELAGLAGRPAPAPPAPAAR